MGVHDSGKLYKGRTKGRMANYTGVFAIKLQLFIYELGEIFVRFM
ncbi:hypothetical protein ACU8KH_00431 [Lachancea thermotolerans]